MDKLHVSTLLTLYVDATLLTSSCANASMLAAIFVRLQAFANVPNGHANMSKYTVYYLHVDAEATRPETYAKRPFRGRPSDKKTVMHRRLLRK